MTTSEILGYVMREMEADRKAFPYFPQQSVSMVAKIQEPANELLKMAMSLNYGQLKENGLTLEDLKPLINEQIFKTIAACFRTLNALNK